MRSTVAVIGAGVSGLAMGLRLRRAGVPFAIFEKGSEVGGTWRENRYPGLTIDVPSPLYTFTGHRHPGWRRWMPDWREILDYHREVSVRSGVREHIRFDCEVVGATWTGDEWEVETAAGDVERFRVLICATSRASNRSPASSSTRRTGARRSSRRAGAWAWSATARPACSSSARSAAWPPT